MHSELCPVCKGSGKLPNPDQGTTTALSTAGACLLAALSLSSAVAAIHRDMQDTGDDAKRTGGQEVTTKSRASIDRERAKKGAAK